MMMEEAVAAGNWEAALCSVERNAGAPGPDGMKARELREHLAKHGEGIKGKLLKGSFQPSAARRKEIPKPNGGTRPLSIPNVLDRFIQQLLLQVMAPLFEPIFSESSHGFRPGRSAHGAIEAAQELAREGREWVVDMDITKFFDRVNHDILMTQVSCVVRDKRVLQLIGRFLRAGIVLPDGCCVRSTEGTPQGGPLSPLLANIYLDKLDRELERRGYKHVRYADDCNIYVSSRQAAERAMENISQWISECLRLQVNTEKSGIGRVWERKFLGFILTMALLIGVSPQALARFKDQVRSKWDARQSLDSTQLRDQWNQYLRGWWGYYRRAEDRKSILRQGGWIRRHIRKWLPALLVEIEAGCLAALGSGSAGITPADAALPSSGWELPAGSYNWPPAVAARGAWRPPRPYNTSSATVCSESMGSSHHLTSTSRDRPRVVSNRRMRKTARPVVWEP